MKTLNWTVLIADDKEITRKAITAILKTERYEVTGASNIEQALQPLEISGLTA